MCDNKNTKRLIYFPSLSSLYNSCKTNKQIGNTITYRFYDDSIDENFRHKYFLLSAGSHYKKKTMRKDMGLDNGSLVMGDSGGFQICSGVLKYSESIVHELFEWLEHNSDIAMNLDIPPRKTYEGHFEDALNISYKNFRYFSDKQSGKTDFLNILQPNTTYFGYKKWYDKVNGFDFNGWSIGAAKDISYTLYTFALLLQNRELEKKSCKYVHYLGKTAIDDLFIYSFLQYYCNKYYPHVNITCDSSTPIMQIVFGNWIFDIDFKDLCWHYVYMGNKGKMKYNSEGKLPCIIECPICRELHYSDVEEGDSLAKEYMNYHNLFMYTNALKKISKFTEGSLEMYKDFYSSSMPDFYKILTSINEMFEYPDKALTTFEKYKPVYESFTLKEKVNVEHKIIDDLFD